MNLLLKKQNILINARGLLLDLMFTILVKKMNICLFAMIIIRVLMLYYLIPILNIIFHIVIQKVSHIISVEEIVILLILLI